MPPAGDRARRADGGRGRRTAPDAQQGFIGLNKQGHRCADDLPRRPRALCGRIAMLKAGPRGRAPTHLGAARRHREHVLRFKTDAMRCWPVRRGQARVTGASCRPRRANPVEVTASAAGVQRRGPGDQPAPTWRTCSRDHTARRAGADGGRWRSGGRLSAGRQVLSQIARGRTRPRFAGTAHRRCTHGRCCASGRSRFQTIAAPVLTAGLYLLIFGHVLQGRVRCTTASATQLLIPWPQ